MLSSSSQQHQHQHQQRRFASAAVTTESIAFTAPTHSPTMMPFGCAQPRRMLSSATTTNAATNNQRVMVTGALGQIGSELVDALRAKHGTDAVLATDLADNTGHISHGKGPFKRLSVTDSEAMTEMVEAEGITTIYHLAALLSVTGEANPDLCMEINVGGSENVCEAARINGARVYMPSSIAVFGDDTPRLAPQSGMPLNPSTVYGKTKIIGEEMAIRYWREHGVDVRGIRYPGLVSYKAPAGGGTTDFAVEIFTEALAHGRYTCFVRPDTILPMMYMDDAIRATIELMDAPADVLGDARGGYNVTGCQPFTAEELVTSIRRHLPELEVLYEPDDRQLIADSWSDAMDDSVARSEWGWQPMYDLDAMVDRMFQGLRGELDTHSSTCSSA